MSDSPHRCRCLSISSCQLMQHPDARVQAAADALIEEVTRFDDATGSKSIVVVTSLYDGGTFQSVTGDLDQRADALSRQALALLEELEK